MRLKDIVKETINKEPVRAEFIEQKLESARYDATKSQQKILEQQHLAKLAKIERNKNLKSSIY